MRRKSLSRKSVSAVGFAVFASLGASAAKGQTLAVWTNGGGDNIWSDPANWSIDFVPNGNFDVVIGSPTPTNDDNGFAILNMSVNAGAELNILNGSAIAFNGSR